MDIAEKLATRYPLEADSTDGVVFWGHIVSGASEETVLQELAVLELPAFLTFSFDQQEVFFKFWFNPQGLAEIHSMGLSPADVLNCLSLDAFRHIVSYYAEGEVHPDFFLLGVPRDYRVVLEVYMVSPDGRAELFRAREQFTVEEYFSRPDGGIDRVGSEVLGFVLDNYILGSSGSANAG